MIGVEEDTMRFLSTLCVLVIHLATVALGQSAVTYIEDGHGLHPYIFLASLYLSALSWHFAAQATR